MSKLPKSRPLVDSTADIVSSLYLSLQIDVIDESLLDLSSGANSFYVAPLDLYRRPFKLKYVQLNLTTELCINKLSVTRFTTIRRCGLQIRPSKLAHGNWANSYFSLGSRQWGCMKNLPRYAPGALEFSRYWSASIEKFTHPILSMAFPIFRYLWKTTIWRRRTRQSERVWGSPGAYTCQFCSSGNVPEFNSRDR